MTQIPNQQTFKDAYAGEAPWDVGRPQDAFVAVADRVVSPVLDAGCGTGDIALFFAARRHRVTGRRRPSAGCRWRFAFKTH